MDLRIVTYDRVSMMTVHAGFGGVGFDFLLVPLWEKPFSLTLRDQSG